MESVRVGILFCVLGISILSTCTAESKTCEGDQLECAISKLCVPINWKCDGDKDCGKDDLSDELDCPAVTCTQDEFVCANNSKCIPGRWHCDGEPDCADNSDEDPAMCVNKTCAGDEFKCSDNKCIALTWKCDGSPDCDDGSDEKNCDHTCLPEEFRCNDGRCIHQTWFCDGDTDCLDSSDESNCSMPTCMESEFKCVNSSKCIGKRWRCDGDFDCSDHSDEEKCDGSESLNTDICPSTDFMCEHTLECVHSGWVCDGDLDCDDGTDESPDRNCSYTCDANKFQCENHHCIPEQLRCDQNEDCIDGSDEIGCPSATVACTLDEFDCYGDSSLCIARDRVCDGHFDCHKGEDEDPAMCKENDPCQSTFCGDHSKCVVNLQTRDAVCECFHGFEMVDGSCKDINECNGTSTVCSQKCENTKGGYKCSCHDGYVLEGHWECRAAGEKPWLFYANRRDIRRLRVDSHYMEVIVEGTDNSVALDVDIHENLIFWTEGAVEMIKSARFHNSTMIQASASVEVIKTGITTPDGIAVDWLYKHFYWTDSGTDTISVATYDGSKRTTVITEGLDEPRAICLDPENGYMYWTDWGKDPKIERSGMNGQDRTALVTRDSDIQWPNGLTIDYLDKRMYWIDAKLHKIGSARLDGTDTREVIINHEEIKRPFSISVFEDHLYWTDWSNNSIKSVNKLTGGSNHTLSTGSYSVRDIKVVHHLRQDKSFAETATSLCIAARCEYLCLPAPKTGETASVTCACQDSKQLTANGKTCELAPARGCIDGDGIPVPFNASFKPQRDPCVRCHCVDGEAKLCVTDPCYVPCQNYTLSTETCCDFTCHDRTNRTNNTSKLLSIVALPIELDVRQVGSSLAIVQWNVTGNAEVDQVLYKLTSERSWSAVRTTSGEDMHILQTLSPDKTYQIKVAAYDEAAGRDVPSPIVIFSFEPRLTNMLPLSSMKGHVIDSSGSAYPWKQGTEEYINFNAYTKIDVTEAEPSRCTSEASRESDCGSIYVYMSSKEVRRFRFTNKMDFKWAAAHI